MYLLLHKIDCRLTRVEERLKDLHEIKTHLDDIRRNLNLVQIKYAALAAAVALVVSGVVKLF